MAISEKTKFNLKKGAILCVLFLGAFFIGFYAVNLDLHPGQNGITVKSSTIAAPSVDLNAEFQKKMGSTTVSVESYDDWAKREGLDASNNALEADPDHDGLPNYLEYAYGTNPLKADTDGDGFSDQQEIVNGYDPVAPGDAKPAVQITIAKLSIQAPMVWSQSADENAMLSDLQNGVSHFYKTAAPGQNGNAIISGHSSNYAWDKGNYNHIFKDLNNLQSGDGVTVKTTESNGRVITYAYKVTDKFTATADDQKIFADTPTPTLTLTTCWPIGTSLKRLIVKAALVQ